MSVLMNAYEAVVAEQPLPGMTPASKPAPKQRRFRCKVAEVHEKDDYIVSFEATLPEGWTGKVVGRVYLDGKTVWDRWRRNTGSIAACTFTGREWEDAIGFARLPLEGSVPARRYRPKVTVERVRPPNVGQAILALDELRAIGEEPDAIREVIVEWIRGEGWIGLAETYDMAARQSG